MKNCLLLSGIFVAVCAVSFAQTNNSQSTVTTSTKSETVSETTNESKNNPYNITDNSNLIFTNTPDNPGPVYVNTGNVEEDTKNYKIAKDQWIKENTVEKEIEEPK